MMNKAELIQKGKKEAKRIINKSRSYLIKAISGINDEERVNAFNVMYFIMRIVDDLVDEKNSLTKEEISKEIEKWQRMVLNCYSGKPDKTPVSLAFFESISKFKIPKKVWTNFFNSMRKDISKKSFKAFSEFEKYCLGATCAPTIIYLFIILSEKEGNEYVVNDVNYLKIGRDLGIWAYIVHILRDVKKDADNSLFYIPENELKKFKLKNRDLIIFSKKGRADERYNKFLGYYIKKASGYYIKSIKKTEEQIKKIPKDRAFSILVILKTYKELERRLLLRGETVFSGKKLLSEEEHKKIEIEVANLLK